MHADRDKRSREDRRARRFQRAADRKAHRVRKRALRNAPVTIDEHGTASVTVQPGRITEQRWKRFGPRYNEAHSPAVEVPQPAGERCSPRRSSPVPREEHPRDEVHPTTVEEQLTADGAHLVDGIEAYLRQTTNPAEEQARNGVPRPADLRWEHRGTPEVQGEEHPEGHRGTPEVQGTAVGNTSAVWTWQALRNAFLLAIDDDAVNPHSQRDIASVMKCSKDRAKELKQLFINGKL